MEIKNKIACVTGASKGIGKATALALSKEGAKIAISARSKQQLEDTAESILHMLMMPQRAMVSEIDIRPSNPG